MQAPYVVPPMAIGLPLIVTITQLLPAGQFGAATLHHLRQTAWFGDVLKHPNVAAQSAPVVHEEPWLPGPDPPQRENMRIAPIASCAGWHEVPAAGQPTLVAGLQSSLHIVTSGIEPPLPSFSVMTQSPPGALQSESVEQYFAHVLTVFESCTHR